MYKVLFFLLLIVSNSLSAQKKYQYPVAPKDSNYNQYFDTTVYDPYQWMEDPNDPRLADWLLSQEKICNKTYRNQLHKDDLEAQMSAMYYGEEKEEIDGYVESKKENDSKYEFKTNRKTYNRAPDLTYRKKGGLYKTLVNIKDFQENKKDHVVITKKRVNNDEDLIAIEISHNGGDWREVYFYDLVTGKKLNDSLLYLRAGSSVVWDGRGVYYDHYAEPQEGYELINIAKKQAIYYHKVGTRQVEDKLLYSNPDTSDKKHIGFGKLDSTNLLLFHPRYSGTKAYNALGYVALNEGESFTIKDFIVYPDHEDIEISFEEKFGAQVVLKTNWNAPNGKVLIANINKQNDLRELVPEYDVVLRSVNQLGKDNIACIYRNDGKYTAVICNLTGEVLSRLDFPEGKKLSYFYESDTSVAYTDFCISSFHHPNLWYQLSLKDFTFKPSHSVSVPFNPEDVETRYVKYKSKDGTEIPMYITCLKSTKLDGNNPTLIYGYGGYGIVVEPHYSKFSTLFVLHGGVYVVPNIRGGGVGGGDWSKAGRGLNKQNAIDDFVAAAEYLVEEEYTNSEKLAITGGSHGGLLVGAALTQRPELYKACIAKAGAYDMLRFEKFTVGGTQTNLNEYGTILNRDDFDNLLSYSPLHNIKSGVAYPNVLLMTGDKDDRVPPLHSYKFLATLQDKGSKKSLYQIYIAEGAAHNGAVTSKDWSKEQLFKLYFIMDELGVKFW